MKQEYIPAGLQDEPDLLSAQDILQAKADQYAPKYACISVSGGYFNNYTNK